MVQRALPKSLVKRLRRIIKIKVKPIRFHENDDFNKMLGRLRNVDHRRGEINMPLNYTKYWGRRVRALNVKRNYPSVGDVVIKRTHNLLSAEQEVFAIRNAVKIHNEKFSNQLYILKVPKAHAISKEHMAMSRIDFPSLEEVIFPILQTPRGKEFYKNILSDPQNRNLTLPNLLNIYFQLTKNYGHVSIANLLFTGVKDGKPIFTPLIDFD